MKKLITPALMFFCLTAAAISAQAETKTKGFVDGRIALLELRAGEVDSLTLHEYTMKQEVLWDKFKKSHAELKRRYKDPKTDKAKTLNFLCRDHISTMEKMSQNDLMFYPQLKPNSPPQTTMFRIMQHNKAYVGELQNGCRTWDGMKKNGNPFDKL